MDRDNFSQNFDIKDSYNALKPSRKKTTIRIIKLYIIPIISIAVFLMIMFALVVPKINFIFSTLDNISSLNTQIEQSNKQLEELAALNSNSNTILQQLDVINQIAPNTKTEVVKFRDKITTMAEDNGLAVIFQRLSETDTTTNPTGIQDASALSLQQVPFLFEIQGSYDNLIKFIQSLSTGDDFLIVQEMELSSKLTVEGVATSEWVLKLKIAKYQFNVYNEDILNILYAKVPATTLLNITE
jgi:hypothetical protein